MSTRTVSDVKVRTTGKVDGIMYCRTHDDFAIEGHDWSDVCHEAWSEAPNMHGLHEVTENEDGTRGCWSCDGDVTDQEDHDRPDDVDEDDMEWEVSVCDLVPMFVEARHEVDNTNRCRECGGRLDSDGDCRSLCDRGDLAPFGTTSRPVPLLVKRDGGGPQSLPGDVKIVIYYNDGDSTWAWARPDERRGGWYAHTPHFGIHLQADQLIGSDTYDPTMPVRFDFVGDRDIVITT